MRKTKQNTNETGGETMKTEYAMTIKQAHPRGYCQPDGKGFVLYGTRPDNGKWMERWYPTKDKALQFANKRGWPTNE